MGDASEQSARLELYQMAVEMADRTSARRGGANSFFVTLNASLATVVGLLSSAQTDSESTTHGAVASTMSATYGPFGLCVASSAGIVFSLTWWAMLRYYR